MSDTLFDLDPSHPNAPVHASFVRRPKEEADPSEPSPFGSAIPEGYARAEGLDPEEGDSLGVVRFLTGGLGDAERTPIQKAKRYDPREHYDRTYKALRRLFPGGMFWRADYTQVLWDKRVITKDTLGFADAMGLVPPHGSAIAVQITSYGAIGAHLRKYTDPKKTHGAGANPPTIESLLREYLACGGRFLVFGWALPEGKRIWEHELVEVTPALLDEYKARKRVKRG